MNLTHNNHFKFGYDYNWFKFRQSFTEKWMTSYGKCERPVGTFHDECINTAKLIRDNTTEPLRVLFSGGVDSEIVVRSFHEAKIPFKAVICQFNNNLNIHDISYAIVCCQQLNISYDIIQLDIEKFFENDLMQYAENTQCRSPELCSTMWLCDHIDGLPIIGSGECYIVKRVPTDYVDGESLYSKTPWDMYEKELIASWYRHFMISGKERNAVPGFFQYNPEIILSFLKDSRVIDLVNDRVHGKRSTMSSKLSIYQKYFPLIDREKFSGYEKLEKYVVNAQVELHKEFPVSGVFLTEYNDLVSMLVGHIEGPKGMLYDDIYKPSIVIKTLVSKFETRQLTINDYDQVMDLIEQRFATVVEFNKAKIRSMISDDYQIDYEFALNKWRMIIADYYLKGVTHKMFGSFKDGRLMSKVGMRIVHDNGWVLSNLKAQQVPLSETGLKETMTMLYQQAKESGFTNYYCCVAEYRYKKFQNLMKKLVPEYYNEYNDEILTVIEAGEKPTNDFWWSMMGRNFAPVKTVIKKMTLKDSHV